jgi:hypothetical protein
MCVRATFHWVGGAYLLILGLSLLLLPQGQLGIWVDLIWLRGACMAVAGLAVLWLGLVELPRRVTLAFCVVVTVPQLLTVVDYAQLGKASGAAILAFFSAGVLWLPYVRHETGWAGWRPDLLGLVLGACAAAFGLGLLLGDADIATLQRLGVSPSLFGAASLASGSAVVAAQLLPRIPSALRWAAQLLCGTIIWLLAVLMARLAPEYWVLDAAGYLRGSATAVLPWLTARADYVDRHAFRPRLAMALLAVGVAPVLVVAPLLLNAVAPQLAQDLPARQGAFGVVLAVLLCAVLVGWWLAGQLVAPIAAMAREVDRLAHGERPEAVDLASLLRELCPPCGPTRPTWIAS